MKITTEAYHNEKTTIVEGKRQRHRVEVVALGPNNAILACPIEVNGYIELPGGGVDNSETLVQAAIREVEEEAGWVISDVEVIEIPGTWIYKDRIPTWLKENGYDEECNFAVVCKAVEYNPKSNHHSEGDGKLHKLIPFDQVIQETQEALKNATDPRVIMLSNFRLAILGQLVNIPSIAVEAQPLYVKW